MVELIAKLLICLALILDVEGEASNLLIVVIVVVAAVLFVIANTPAVAYFEARRRPPR